MKKLNIFIEMVICVTLKVIQEKEGKRRRNSETAMAYRKKT